MCYLIISDIPKIKLIKEMKILEEGTILVLKL